MIRRQAVTPASRERWLVLSPLVLVAGPAWVVLAMAGSRLMLPALCSSELLWSVPSTEGYAFFLTYVSPRSLAVSWAVMVAAMMLPTLGGLLGHVRLRSFHALSPRLVGLVILGYGAAWMLAGVAFLAVALTLLLAIPSRDGPFFVAILLALVWQASPWRQSARNCGHKNPKLAAFAPVAYRNALAAGVRQGLWCVASCWALMLASLLAPAHHFAVMLAVALWIWADQLEPPHAPAWQFRIPNRALRLAAYWVSRPKPT